MTHQTAANRRLNAQYRRALLFSIEAKVNPEVLESSVLFINASSSVARRTSDSQLS